MLQLYCSSRRLVNFAFSINLARHFQHWDNISVVSFLTGGRKKAGLRKFPVNSNESDVESKQKVGIYQTSLDSLQRCCIPITFAGDKNIPWCQCLDWVKEAAQSNSQVQGSRQAANRSAITTRGSLLLALNRIHSLQSKQYLNWRMAVLSILSRTYV